MKQKTTLSRRVDINNYDSIYYVILSVKDNDNMETFLILANRFD